MTKTTEQVLRDAADAAKRVLPDAEKEVEAAQRALQDASAKITRLRAVIAAGYPQTPASGTVTSDASWPNYRRFVYLGTGVQDPPLPIRAQISYVLTTSKQPLTPREINQRVEVTSGNSIPQSTLYYTLAKGEEQGWYKKDDEGRWTTAKSEGR